MIIPFPDAGSSGDSPRGSYHDRGQLFVAFVSFCNPETSADGDAAHIALATIHEMDILLTWNCRHIANAAIVGRLRRLTEAQGYTLPEIYTPEELLGE